MSVREETHKTFKDVQHHSAWCMHSHSAAFDLTVLLGLCLSPTNMQRDTTGLDGELSQITDLHQSRQVGPASCVACLMEKHCTGGGGQAETCQLQYLPNVQACTSTAQVVAGKLRHASCSTCPMYKHAQVLHRWWWASWMRQSLCARRIWMTCCATGLESCLQNRLRKRAAMLTVRPGLKHVV